MTRQPAALVVFSGVTHLWWLRALKPGFRHCFLALPVAVSDGAWWITIDPMAHRTEIALQPVGPAFDLAGWYRERGLTVVAAPIVEPPPRPAPWRPLTCVETVKRILGLRAPGVWTPWQLYRHLLRKGGNGTSENALDK